MSEPWREAWERRDRWHGEQRPPIGAQTAFRMGYEAAQQEFEQEAERLREQLHLVGQGILDDLSKVARESGRQRLLKALEDAKAANDLLRHRLERAERGILTRACRVPDCDALVETTHSAPIACSRHVGR